MKNIKYTWNLNNSNFTSIILQYSLDGVTWTNATTINTPANIGNSTTLVDENATYFRIVGDSPYSHCSDVNSNVIDISIQPTNPQLYIKSIDSTSSIDNPFPPNPCEYDLIEGVYIFGQHTNLLPTGNNIVCLSQSLSNRFNGQDKWWRFKNANAAAQDPSVVLRVDANGVIYDTQTICQS